MGTRKSARLAAVCIGAATFVAAVPVLCAELQQRRKIGRASCRERV